MKKTNKELADECLDTFDKMFEDPVMKIVMDALAAYDAQYRGNVPKEEAEKMFPELKKKKK